MSEYLLKHICHEYLEGEELPLFGQLFLWLFKTKQHKVLVFGVLVVWYNGSKNSDLGSELYQKWIPNSIWHVGSLF